MGVAMGGVSWSGEGAGEMSQCVGNIRAIDLWREREIIDSIIIRNNKTTLHA